MKENPFVELVVTLFLLITVIVAGSFYQKHKQQIESTPVPTRTELKVGSVEAIPKQDIRVDKQKRAEENIKLTFEQASKRTQ